MDKHVAPVIHTGDILVLLKLAAMRKPSASVRELEGSLGLSKSNVSNSMQRLAAAGLIVVDEKGKGRRINNLALRDCLEHGVRWIAPARVGDWELGLLTAHSARPLADKLVGDRDDVVVMPLAHGPHRGRSVQPIHPRAPEAASRDERLHQVLAIVDAFRIGRARDRQVAAEELAAWL